jgi:hypothetical protein
MAPVAGRFSFDDLLRIHPAASRVKKLAAETPALFLAFDLLLKGGSDLAGDPLRSEDFAHVGHGASTQQYLLSRRGRRSAAPRPATEYRAGE